MTPNVLLPPVLLAETLREVRWHSLPPAWVLVMVLAPLAILIGWWCYRRESDLPPRARWTLSTLRTVAIVLFLLLLFGPHAEVRDRVDLKSHLLVLFDTSASMATVDGYEPEDARALADATGMTPDQVVSEQRLTLAKRLLTHPDNGLLQRFTEDFRLHVFSFGSYLTPVVSTGDSSQPDDETTSRLPAAERVAVALRDLSPTAPSTRLGQAVSTAIDTFNLRDERVAAVIVFSDGQQNGGSVSPLQAGRRARAQHVPVYAVGVGDPRSPKNIHVSNLRAKEVVLARDTAVFEFTVRAKGFDGLPVPVEIRRLGPEGEPTGSPLSVNPSEIRLVGGDKEQKVKVRHRFDRAGTYSLRVGVPVQSEEKIKSDNFALHTIRVIDRKIKVLYVEGPPRYEYQFLSNALIRDYETLLAHALLLDGDPGMLQRATRVADWTPLRHADGLPDREELFKYDVIVLGDVDWRGFAGSQDERERALENLREFVEKGGGLLYVAGAMNNPTKYQRTPLDETLPIVIDRNTELRDSSSAGIDMATGFAMRVTAEGQRSPLVNVMGDPKASKQRWESDPDWRQFWSYPAQQAKTGARVLMVSDHPAHQNRFGPRPLVATMLYGRGRTMYIGVDELWRTRKYVGDRYYYRFYGEAIRFLATYKLLGGNYRFKIITDRDKYTLDTPVRITLDVLDEDYNPSTKDFHVITIDMPGSRSGSRDTVDLEIPKDPREPGTFTKTIVPTRPGDYRLSARTDDGDDEQPKKVFQVVESTLEGRDLLLDEAALREVADGSDAGVYLHLWDAPEKLTPPAKSTPVTTNPRSRELWDNGWALFLALLLLGAEWLLRKRWHLV